MSPLGGDGGGGRRHYAGSARAALRGGWRDLWRWPVVTALALVAATTGALAVRAGAVRAAGLVQTAGVLARGEGSGFAQTSLPSPLDLLWRAFGLVLVAHALGALVVDIANAIALSAYAGPPPPAGERARWRAPARLGLERTPAMITIRAVELLLYYALGAGTLFVGAAALLQTGAGPLRRALVTAAALTPALALGVVTFAAARVAQSLVARGLTPARALVHGLDLTYRRFPSLARLALLALVATLPLSVCGWFLPTPLAAPLWALASLWTWAALVRLVGSDGRLAIG